MTRILEGFRQVAIKPVDHGVLVTTTRPDGTREESCCVATPRPHSSAAELANFLVQMGVQQPDVARAFDSPDTANLPDLVARTALSGFIELSWDGRATRIRDYDLSVETPDGTCTHPLRDQAGYVHISFKENLATIITPGHEVSIGVIPRRISKGSTTATDRLNTLAMLFLRLRGARDGELLTWDRITTSREGGLYPVKGFDYRAYIKELTQDQKIPPNLIKLQVATNRSTHTTCHRLLPLHVAITPAKPFPEAPPVDLDPNLC